MSVATAPSEQFSGPSESVSLSITSSQVRRPVWRVGLVAGAVASAANSAFAAVVHQFGVSLTIAGEQIPILGFAQLTMVGALLGIALAAVLARRSGAPRTWFVRVTVALTALSLVPDVIVDADLGTRVTLGLTHLIAAAIVVPVIARRLPR
jgi:hypothetical protein